jgi:ABC-type transport system involved in cytochrome c biogenesis permease subunit
MMQLSDYLLTAAIAFIVVAFLINAVVAASRTSAGTARRTGAQARPVAVGAPAGPGLDADLAELDDAPAPGPARAPSRVEVGALATGFTVVAWALLTAYLVIRIVLTGHSPFTNMHEYAVSFVWGILAAWLVAYWRFKVRLLSLIALPAAAVLLAFAMSITTEIDPLIPALQNSLLLTLHVGFAIPASGAACVSLAAAVLYLVRPRMRRLRISRDRFEEMGYKAAVVTFPLWTMMLLFGALWANVAWGSYWSWDPKETAALVTWLLYGAYLHARVVAGWRGTRAVWLLVISFAAVLFTLFGNYFFGGLHAYA